MDDIDSVPDLQPTLVIGLGSPQGDDQAGWRLIERVQRHAALPADLLAVREPIELLEQLAGRERLIIVDACVSGQAPGTIVRRAGPELASTGRPPQSTHGLGLWEVLRLAEQLGRLPRQVILLGLEIAPPQPGQEASAVLPAALDELERCILKELNREPSAAG